MPGGCCVLAALRHQPGDARSCPQLPASHALAHRAHTRPHRRRRHVYEQLPPMHKLAGEVLPGGQQLRQQQSLAQYASSSTRHQPVKEAGDIPSPVRCRPGAAVGAQGGGVCGT